MLYLPVFVSEAKEPSCGMLRLLMWNSLAIAPPNAEILPETLLFSNDEFWTFKSVIP